MRKMYSEEQVKAIAKAVVANTLAELGISLNQDGEIAISKDMVFAHGKKIYAGTVETAKLTAHGSQDLEITTGAGGEVKFTGDNNFFSGSTYFGWDEKEAMGVMWLGTYDNPIVSMLPNGGKLSVIDTNAEINFNSVNINMPNVPTTDPTYPGRIWNDSNDVKFGSE